ncbi:MAG: hypothetical protein J6Q13_03500 [Clostridia bacterium]|nr:hypothetical protein [Clostridia bacterium]
MLTTFDLTSVLAYKVMKENDIHDQTEFSKEELQQYFITVLSLAKEVGCDWEKLTEEKISEIKDRLSCFCKVQEDCIIVDNTQFKPKRRRLASMYVQGWIMRFYGVA